MRTFALLGSILLVVVAPAVSAREESLPCTHRVGFHEVGAVAQCKAAGRNVLVIAGDDQQAFCDPSVPNIIVVVGNGNTVSC